MRNSPAAPRALAIRSGKARATSLPQSIVSHGSGLFPAGSLREGPRQPAGVVRARRALAPEALEALREVGRIAAKSALDEKGRDLGGGEGGALGRGGHHHFGEARR